MKIVKIIAIVVVVLCFCLFINQTDMQQVMLSIGKIGYRFIYLLLITLAAYWMATIGWKYSLGTKAKNIGIAYLFVIRHIGEMVSIINPASVVAGEAVKVYLLQNTEIDKPQVISSVLISRFMMAATQVLLFFATLAYVFYTDHSFFQRLPKAAMWVLALLVLLPFIVLALVKSPYIRNIFGRLKLRFRILQLAERFQLIQIYIGFSTFFKTNKKGLLYCTVFFTLHWIIGSLEVYFILKFLGIKAGIIQVVFVDMGIILFKSAGAFVPGQIGVEELGNKVMLELIGIPDAEVWITVSVLRRSRQVFWIACGMLFYFLYTLKYKGLTKILHGDTVYKS